jgi:hypothetical protein
LGQTFAFRPKVGAFLVGVLVRSPAHELVAPVVPRLESIEQLFGQQTSPRLVSILFGRR